VGGPDAAAGCLSVARPRYGLLLAAVAVGALSVVAGWTVGGWALWVLPFALVVAVCAARGLTLAQVWRGLDPGPEEDPGRGPAGWAP
jgi:uncharacterized protein (DUF58 family)